MKMCQHYLVFFSFKSFIKPLHCFCAPSHLTPISAWILPRCPGQQGQEEGHLGSEAEQPSLCPREGQVCPGQEQQRGPASRTDRPHLAEQGAVGGHPHTDRHCTHKVSTYVLTLMCMFHLFIFSSLKLTIVNVHFLNKSGDHFLDLCPTYCLNDKVMKTV